MFIYEVYCDMVFFIECLNCSNLCSMFALRRRKVCVEKRTQCLVPCCNMWPIANLTEMMYEQMRPD